MTDEAALPDAPEAVEDDRDRGEKPKVEWIPPLILQNRGVPIKLYRLGEDGKLIFDAEDPEAEPPQRTVHLRFNARAVSVVEEMFDGLVLEVDKVEMEAVPGPDGQPLVGPAGPVLNSKVVGREMRTYYGQEAFEHSLKTHPMSTALRVLAVGLGMSEDAMGEAMIPSLHIDYQNAIGVAWAIAQGMDPTEAARMLQRAAAAAAAARQRLASELTETMAAVEDETTGSPGPTGVEPGPQPAVP